MSSDERGVSVGVTAVVVCVLVLGLTVASSLLVVRAAQQTARRGADLGALAAAQTGEPDGCAAARRVAEANGAVVTLCEVEPTGVVQIEAVAPTRLRLPGVPSQVTAAARAVVG